MYRNPNEIQQLKTTIKTISRQRWGKQWARTLAARSGLNEKGLRTFLRRGVTFPDMKRLRALEHALGVSLMEEPVISLTSEAGRIELGAELEARGVYKVIDEVLDEATRTLKTRIRRLVKGE